MSTRSNWVGPTETEYEHGYKLVSRIHVGRSSAGSVLGVDLAPLWHFRTNPPRSAWSLLNIWRKPQFIVADTNGRDLIIIRRMARLPPRFELSCDGRGIGLITLRSIFRTRYSIVFRDGPNWSFRMPLFRVSFAGRSSTGQALWVSLNGERQWSILFSDTRAPLELIAALAFIHRERWCYA
jgi:hypothetical protein